MSYEPERGEEFYCGKCNKSQPPSAGERCRGCGKVTVSWYTKRETLADAMKKWKRVNPNG